MEPCHTLTASHRHRVVRQVDEWDARESPTRNAAHALDLELQAGSQHVWVDHGLEGRRAGSDDPLSASRGSVSATSASNWRLDPRAPGARRPAGSRISMVRMRRSCTSIRKRQVTPRFRKSPSAVSKYMSRKNLRSGWPLHMPRGRRSSVSLASRSRLGTSSGIRALRA